VFKEYFKNPQATNDTKTADGWVHTGDAGYLDERGHLRIIDRAKDVGKLNDGTLFAPKFIENKLKFFPHINEAVAFGHGRDFVAAFVNIDMIAVGDWAERRNIAYASYQELAARPEVYDLFQGEIERVNRDLAADPRMAGAQIRRFLILHKALEADDGELTRTNKVRRGFIAERYKTLVDALYSSAKACTSRSTSPSRTAARASSKATSRSATSPRSMRCPQEGGLRAMASRTRLFNEVLLSVENISLSFGGVKALTDISFDIMKGEVRAIIGPNGAGKSSMLNCINGFYHPQQGAITYKGVKRDRMRPHEAAEQGIARTFQNIALFRGMSTLDNIMTGRNLRMKSGLFWQALRLGPAAREEIEHRKDGRADHRLPRDPACPQGAGRQLPYGLQKRVELGRALAAEPELLLLDEPMAGMNIEEKQDMCRFVLDVNDEFGTTICLIEHDMGVVMDISDRVVVLDYGKKIGDGVPDVVKTTAR
jgi:branched-chain amino acid transport system ATP-binding protein